MMRGSRGGQGVPDPPPPEKFKFLKITLPEILKTKQTMEIMVSLGLKKCL